MVLMVWWCAGGAGGANGASGPDLDCADDRGLGSEGDQLKTWKTVISSLNSSIVLP